MPLAALAVVGLLAASGCAVEGGGNDGSGSEDTGSSAECMLVEDEPPMPSADATIRVRNATDTVQYVLPFRIRNGCSFDPALLAITAPGDTGITPLPPSVPCWEGDRWVVGINRCYEPIYYACGEGDEHDAVAIAPGAVLEVPWDGRVWRDFMDVSNCSPCSFCGGCDIVEGEPPIFLGCQVAVALEPGTGYDLEVAVTSTCPVGDPDACACASETCSLTTNAWANDAEQTVKVQGVVGQDLEVVIAP